VREQRVQVSRVNTYVASCARGPAEMATPSHHHNRGLFERPRQHSSPAVAFEQAPPRVPTRAGARSAERRGPPDPGAAALPLLSRPDGVKEAYGMSFKGAQSRVPTRAGASSAGRRPQIFALSLPHNRGALPSIPRRRCVYEWS